MMIKQERSLMPKRITQSWIFFLCLILVAQQGNFITYKWAGAHVPPLALVFYVLVGSVIMNGIYMLALRNHPDYPIALPKSMWPYVGFVGIIFVINEFFMMSMFHAGGPYSMASAVFLVLSMLLVMSYGVLVLREKISTTRLLGAVTGILAIFLVKLG
jgi:drug/metabolite transporter (DMT)-like permease